MKKMINIRNSIIILLCVTILCMSIGFIVLSIKLDKKNKETVNFNVCFDSYSKVSSTKGGTVEPGGAVDISSNKKVVDMEVTLYAEHDELSYSFFIKNKGSLDAVIVDVMESPDYSDNKFNKLIDPVSIDFNDIVGKELKAGESVELKVTFYYNPSTLKGVRNFKYRLGLITQGK